MKRFILYLTILAVLPIMFMGCGTNCGDAPEANTGGGVGYGVIDPANSFGVGSGDLIGTWRYNFSGVEYELIELGSSGNIVIFDYYNGNIEDSWYGTYTYTVTTLYVALQGESPETYSYELNGDYLTLYFNGNPREYFRVYH
jgi:hypothetical protein